VELAAVVECADEVRVEAVESTDLLNGHDVRHLPLTPALGFTHRAG
jgi:hypothetical protein